MHAIRIVYRVRVVGGELRDETDGSTDTCRWFTPERRRGSTWAARAARADARGGRDRPTQPTAAVLRRRRHGLRPMHSDDRHRHRRPAGPRLRPRPRRRALGDAAPPLRPVARRSSAVPDGSLVVDFVARRPLIGVLGLGLPVAWRSRTWNEPATRRLRFVHVAGATRGMDVTWRIEPRRRRRRGVVDRARLPAAAARLRRVRRPRSSRGRSPAGRWRRSRRIAEAVARPESEPPRRDESIDMTDRRRDLDHRDRPHHADRDRASTRSGPACGPAARRSSASTGSTRRPFR